MKPTNKVSAATAGAALATLIAVTVEWVGGPDAPPAFVGAAATVFAFAFGWFTAD